ncbi:hypothetical protein PsB1_0104 [Candidatus Phycosocius spiralis]|uniref:Uncharacterized protein n=1 Tax=Candidatus Phycosocius spiralis TaxID=2815099 RepID=A0ABQ4PSG8_9PROT|nr:hypothetical protein PsB1_0104 [Candidatus Phycosocius spiralis]
MTWAAHRFLVHLGHAGIEPLPPFTKPGCERNIIRNRNSPLGQHLLEGGLGEKSIAQGSIGPATFEPDRPQGQSLAQIAKLYVEADPVGRPPPTAD